jgi:fructose-bisphosphate aldolase class I
LGPGRLAMTLQPIEATAQALVGTDKGLLAMDESTPTCNARFAALGIAQDEESRRAYRELLVTTPGLGNCISGAILYDETMHQRDRQGTRLVQLLIENGMIPGIKVDRGTIGLALHPDEKITEGLDGLRSRLADYANMGARFAKWRAVIKIGDALPTPGCIQANVQALARYAALCQEAGLVPVVEPEVLMTGGHTMQRCGEVTQDVLDALFEALRGQRVRLEGMVLKPSMILPGENCAEQNPVDEIAAATVACLLESVPAAVAGVAFLSGGQSGMLASARLSAMHASRTSTPKQYPWPLTFSFARAIQHPALDIWRGKPANVVAAQRALYHRAECNRLALQGDYRAAMDDDLVYRQAS